MKLVELLELRRGAKERKKSERLLRLLQLRLRNQQRKGKRQRQHLQFRP